jgi:hypothetical protein
LRITDVKFKKWHAESLHGYEKQTIQELKEDKKESKDLPPEDFLVFKVILGVFREIVAQ